MSKVDHKQWFPVIFIAQESTSAAKFFMSQTNVQPQFMKPK